MPVIRRRFFIGCEGSGERSLAIVLQRFAEEMGLPVHIDAFDAHGGSPVAVLKICSKEMKSRSQTRGPYDGGRFILLDQDRIDRDGCNDVIVSLARRSKINLVRQIISLECLLVRLLSNKYDLGPERAKDALKRIWPTYSHGFDAATLKSKLTLAQLQSSCRISDDWQTLLQSIGLLG